MKKICAYCVVAGFISACGGGGKAEPFDPTATNLTPPSGVLRSDLKMDGFPIASRTALYWLGFDTNTSTTNTYTPNKEIDLNSSKVGMKGNSLLTFKSDRSITLDSEQCITTEDDCSLYREVALAGGYVKMKDLGKSSFEYYKIDKVPYSRTSLTLTNTQRYTNSKARTYFGSTIANVFDIYHLDSYDGIKDGDRSALKNANYIDVIDGRKNIFHDATATRYWGKDGVVDGTKTYYPTLLAMTTKNSFSQHARLGLFLEKTFIQDSGSWKSPYYATHSVVYGTRTRVSNISSVSVTYYKKGGWNATGILNGKAIFVRGDVSIRMNTSTQKITGFNVQDMKQYELDDSINKIDDTTGKNFLPEVNLRLENNRAVDYSGSNKLNGIYYSAVLTENGISAGTSGKFEIAVIGSFYGANTDATAGSFVMQKNSSLGDRVNNTLGGGYIAEEYCPPDCN